MTMKCNSSVNKGSGREKQQRLDQWQITYKVTKNTFENRYFELQYTLQHISPPPVKILLLFPDTCVTYVITSMIF
jgi:hypothetical protein